MRRFGHSIWIVSAVLLLFTCCFIAGCRRHSSSNSSAYSNVPSDSSQPRPLTPKEFRALTDRVQDNIDRHEFEPVLETLLPLVQSTSPKLRRYAARTLAKLPGNGGEIRGALEILLDDPVHEVRHAAALSCKQRGHTTEAVITVFVERLDHAVDETTYYSGRVFSHVPGARRGALHSLGDIGPAAKSAVPSIVRVFPLATRTGDNDDEEAVIRALLSIDPEIKEWRHCFAEAMLSESASLPATCVRLAERLFIEAPYLHQHFLALLGDEDARVRQAAALMIYLMEPSLPDCHKDLLPLLDDPLPQVRSTAAGALSKADGPVREYLPKLEELAREDEDPLVRLAAATSIRKLGSVGNLDTLRTIILEGLRTTTLPPEPKFSWFESGSDPNRLFVKSGLEVLGDMREGARDALPFLLMLYDDDVYDRRRLGEIIHKIDETIVLRYF